MLALITGTSFLAMITSHSNECMHACKHGIRAREHTCTMHNVFWHFARATYTHGKVHFEYPVGHGTTAHAMSMESMHVRMQC